jgi:hypothetical protein
MSISYVLPLPIGNALKVLLDPPADALTWRVLRTVGTSFTGVDDASAIEVYAGSSRFFVDAALLENGVEYTYGDFYYDGSQWIAGDTAAGTPAASYQDQSTDVLTVVRDRLERGLEVEVARGTLRPADGVVEVLNAPPAFEDTRWPVVTVHVRTDGSGDRAVGESVIPDSFDPLAGQFDESEGWLARVHILIVGWTKNPDERIALRQALRRLVIGNLPVFDAAGMTHIDFQQNDDEEMKAFPVPVYQSVCSLTCSAPAFVTDAVGVISDVTLTPTFLTTA